MVIDVAFAVDYGWLDPSKAYDISDIIRIWVWLVILFSWMIAVFFIIWWWVMLILSWWKEDKVKPAMNHIRYSIIWLILIILSIFVLPKIWDMLQLNVSKYISPNSVFSTIQDLSNKFFGPKDEINLNPNSSNTSLPANFSDL